MIKKIANIVVQRPLDGHLSYLIPSNMLTNIQVGSLVRVPFRSKVVDGFVISIEDYVSDLEQKFKLKEIVEVPFSVPVFTSKDLDFFKWIANYYQLPLGEVFYCGFPKSIFVTLKKKSKIKPHQLSTIQSIVSPIELTSDQQNAFLKINQSIESSIYKSFLLHGVTGSGKTEIYLRAVDVCLKKDKSALILVPEIALTPQLRARFVERFGEQVAVLHSSLGEKDRREHWWAILRGEKKVVVGARSALFAPLRNIGLIVVDEEHETSYKQEDRLRYNARDLALVRAKQHDAVVILGSATPSIESFYSASINKHELLKLNSRPKSRPMPEIEVIDLKDDLKAMKKKTSVSKTHVRSYLGVRLKSLLSENLAKAEQSIVFVNRKGFANFLLCEDCGDVPKCLNCDVSLTYYQFSRDLKCHYCAYQIKSKDKCFKCDSINIKYSGIGTELIEEELKLIFPSAKVERIDAETADSIKKIESILDRLKNGDIDILVGTQMLAKGHDFPNVTLVGIVLADMSLNLPDFRAAERTFQLLTQVAGRAGRSDKPGRVILQTLLPDHYVIQAVQNQNYDAFYESEIQIRKEFGYPPFSKMAQLEFRHANESMAHAQAEKIRCVLDALNLNELNVDYLGPAAASIARIANQYRWQILIKSEKSSALNAVIKTLRKEGIRFIDVDPVSTL